MHNFLDILAVLFCGILFRLDGWGKGDGFLNVPYLRNIKWGGINYARYAIPCVVFGATLNPLYLLSFGIAVSIPYGEKHWWMKCGLVSWFLYGALLGAASLSWGISLWLGCVVVIAKKYDLDHSLLEFFVLGCGSTLWLLFYN